MSTLTQTSPSLANRAQTALDNSHRLITDLQNPRLQNKPGPITATRVIQELFLVEEELRGSSLPIAQKVYKMASTLGEQISTGQLSQVYNRVFQTKQIELQGVAEKWITTPKESMTPEALNFLAQDLLAYETYKEAANFFLFTPPFSSEAMDLIKEIFQEELLCRSMIIDDLKALNESMTALIQEITDILSDEDAESILKKHPKTMEHFFTLQESVRTCIATPSNKVYAKDLYERVEKMYPKIEQAISQNLSIHIEAANKALAQRGCQELFERTAITAHHRNQYLYPGAATACAAISVVTLHRLLTNPNAFLDGGATFEEVLGQGALYYQNILEAYNTNITSSESKAAIKTQLIEAFNEAGIEGVIYRLKAYFATFKEEEIRRTFARETNAERVATAIMENPAIRFTRKAGDYLNVHEGPNEIANSIMQQGPSGTIMLIDGAECGELGYLGLLEKLYRMAQEEGAPVGAILHIGMFIFTVSVNPDGSTFIADSHGISYVNTKEKSSKRLPTSMEQILGRSPFALLLANNIEDAAKLLTLHHRGNLASENIQNNTFPYYIYKAKREQRMTSTEEIRGAFGREHRFFREPPVILPPPVQNSVTTHQKSTERDSQRSASPARKSISRSLSSTRSKTPLKTADAKTTLSRSQVESKSSSSANIASSAHTASAFESHITPIELLQIAITDLSPAQKQTQQQTLETLRSQLSYAQKLQSEKRPFPKDLPVFIRSLIDSLEPNIRTYYEDEYQKHRTFSKTITTIGEIQNLLR